MKGILLISGGIDSVVAGYMVMKQGMDLAAVHFKTEPFGCAKPLEKTRILLKKLARARKKKIKLYTIPHGKNLQAFLRNTKRNIMCILCRRVMYRVAERIALKEKAQCLVTGEALAQKASQTLENLYVIDRTIKLPVVRPLIGFDKDETMAIAREIGTYEISTLPGSCCNAVPKHPSTRASESEILDNEKKLDIKNLIKNSIKKGKVEVMS